MTMLVSCRICGKPISPANLACPACGALVHKERLEQLASIASSLEATDRAGAIVNWHQALALLPPDSQQARVIEQRVRSLQSSDTAFFQGAADVRDDPLPLALFKTAISMACTIWFLWLISDGDWWFALGSTLLILVHEMGHVIANKWYGLKASPPIFLGPFGAVIYLRTPPPNAWVEAIIGIAGPVLGTIGAVAVFVYAKMTGSRDALYLAEFGFFLNLINLLPVPPLDGGRVASAISPRLWVAGLVGLAGLLVWRATHGGLRAPTIFIVVWLLSSAVPRIAMTLKNMDRLKPYYDIGTRRRTGMGLFYFALAVALFLLHRLSDTGMSW